MFSSFLFIFPHQFRSVLCRIVITWNVFTFCSCASSVQFDSHCILWCLTHLADCDVWLTRHTVMLDSLGTLWCFTHMADCDAWLTCQTVMFDSHGRLMFDSYGRLWCLTHSRLWCLTHMADCDAWLTWQTLMLDSHGRVMVDSHGRMWCLTHMADCDVWLTQQTVLLLYGFVVTGELSVSLKAPWSCSCSHLRQTSCLWIKSDSSIFVLVFFVFFFLSVDPRQHILSVISLVAAAPRRVEPPAVVPHTFNPHLTWWWCNLQLFQLDILDAV